MKTIAKFLPKQPTCQKIKKSKKAKKKANRHTKKKEKCLSVIDLK
jgi:hypothetical protein